MISIPTVSYERRWLPDARSVSSPGDVVGKAGDDDGPQLIFSYLTFPSGVSVRLNRGDGAKPPAGGATRWSALSASSCDGVGRRPDPKLNRGVVGPERDAAEPNTASVELSLD